MPQSDWLDRYRASQTVQPTTPTPSTSDWLDKFKASQTPTKSKSLYDRIKDLNTWGDEKINKAGSELYDLGKGMLDMMPINAMKHDSDLLNLYDKDPVAAQAQFDKESKELQDSIDEIKNKSILGKVGVGIKTAANAIDPTGTIPGYIGLGEQAVGNVRKGEYTKALTDVSVGALPFLLHGIGGSKAKVSTEGIPAEALPQEPKVKVVPQLTEVAGADPSVKRFPNRLALPPKTERTFISHPSGKLASSLDPNAVESLRSLDLEQPDTQITGSDLRPGDFTTIEPKETEPWNFDEPGVRKGPESNLTPRRFGVQAINPETGEVTARPQEPVKMKDVKVVDPQKPFTKKGKPRYKTISVPENATPEYIEMVRQGKIDPETTSVSDFTDISTRDKQGNIVLKNNPLLSTVPERLLPEAPNVANIRNLAKGAGKVGDVAPPSDVTFQETGETSGWGKEPTVVNLTEEGKGRRGSKLRYPSETPLPDLPSAPVSKGRTLPTITERAALPPVEPIEKPPVSQDQIESAGRGKSAKDYLGETSADITDTREDTKSKEGIRDKMFYDRFMKANPTFKAIMDALIKQRSATDLIGQGVLNKFKHIAQFGKDNIADFQKAIGEGKFPEVRQFFDNLHSNLQRNGIDLGYKENYLPQMWDNSVQEIQRAFGSKELNKTASFMFESLIKDYQEGIDKGLTPKYSPVELMKYYAERANKLIADRQALNRLRTYGYLVDKEAARPNYQIMDKNLLRGKEQYADPRVRRVIENYLLSQQDTLGKSVAKTVGKSANMMLSSGVIPYKPLATAHGINIAARSALQGGFKGLGRAIKYGLNPEAGARMLEAENAQMQEAVIKHGASFNVGETGKGPRFFENANNAFKKGTNKFVEIQNRWFEEPLLNKMLPALKWDAWKEAYSKGIEGGMSEAEAGAHATRISDNFYGGQNLDLLYNNRHFNDLVRSTFLAPDWLKTNIRLGKEMGRAMNLHSSMAMPERMQYLKMSGRILAAYTAADLLQKATTGKWMHDNDKGHKFEIEAGKTADGKVRRIKFLGGAADFIQTPMEMVPAAIGSLTSKDDSLPAADVADYVKNRLSAPVALGLSAFGTHTDYMGRPNITATKDIFNRPIPASEKIANTFGQLAGYGPPQLSTLYDAATGRRGPEEAFARLAELPVNYGGFTSRNAFGDFGKKKNKLDFMQNILGTIMGDKKKSTAFGKF